MDRRPSLWHILKTDTLIGLISPAMFVWFAPTLTARQFWLNIWAGQVFAHAIGSLAHLSMFYAYPRISGWKPAPRWTVVFAILAADAALGSAVAGLVLILAGTWDANRYFSSLIMAFRVGFIITLIMGIGAVLAETMKAKLNWATSELRTKELENARALKLATEARLSSLESRIHPHFLFNALNSISSLIREDPDRAERLIERMASLLRFSLDTNQLGVVTVEQELRIVEGYLEIERARFGSRLQYSIDVDASLYRETLPPLSIQTLVENAVKHSISTRREGGSIVVSSVRRDSELQVEVWDDGPGFRLDAVPTGHGLDLLISRLQTIYEGSATLHVRGSSVILTLPCSAPISSTTRN